MSNTKRVYRIKFKMLKKQ